jgi:Heterokaryon incompatibility protein (HET)
MHSEPCYRRVRNGGPAKYELNNSSISQRCELTVRRIVPGVDVESKNEELYTALDIEDYQIRILTILPDSNDSPLRCRLTTMSLLYPKPYVALSYCWGDPDLRGPIDVNGFEFMVTVNLSYALRQLRDMGKYKVWADAICINQNDRQERSLQVRFMRQIFSKANEVVACVGIDSETNKEAIAILSQPTCLFVGKHRHPGSLTSRLRMGTMENSDQEYLEDLKARAQRSKGLERRTLDKFSHL